MTRSVECVFHKEDDGYFLSKKEKHFYSLSDAGPYEYLLGALGGCFFSTFKDETKIPCSWDDVKIKINGIKRTSSPTTLESATMSFTVCGCKERGNFLKRIEQTKKDCSIFITLSKVANIETEVIFKD